jgi:ABC-2 type transport system permease protein
VSCPVFKLAIRLRMPSTVAAGIGLIAVMLAVGALFPAVGHSIGALHVPKSVANLLGGADYGTITGWFRSEIGAIYGPLLAGGLAIAGACATLAAEEESRILAVVLAHPLGRRSLVISKAAAVAVVVTAIAFAAWLGLIVGVAAAGGGIPITHMAALAVQLAFFGFATGAVAVAFAATTGNRALAIGAASAIAILGWLINSFAPGRRARLAEVSLPVLLLRGTRSAERRGLDRRPRGARVRRGRVHGDRRLRFQSP